MNEWNRFSIPLRTGESAARPIARYLCPQYDEMVEYGYDVVLEVKDLLHLLEPSLPPVRPDHRLVSIRLDS